MSGHSASRTLLVATGNRAKGIEMAQILSDIPSLRVITFADLDQQPDEVEETGETYAANAALKAVAASRATGFVSIADDAGLEIDALDGAPGLYSKRFLGEETPFPAKMTRILEMLAETPDGSRGCRFRCAVAIAIPTGEVVHCEGICEGTIAREQRGAFGFGYDPIFRLPDDGRHMAELRPEEKHRVSHRGQALACARARLAEVFPPE